MSEWFLVYVRVFFIALVIAYMGTIVVARLARKFGVLDRPDKKWKTHKEPTPRLGGLAIFLAYLVAVACTVRFSEPQRGMIIGGALVLLIGMLDDIRRVPAPIKLLSLVAVTLILARYGVILNLFHNFYINLILTLLWIVGVTSAFNAIDTIDGLATGLAFIASVAYFAVALQTQQWWWGTLTVALMGASLGFLRHNFKTARIFLGDSGSFFLGFTLAAMGVMGGWSENPIKSCLIPILILGVPIFDLGYVIISRERYGITHNIIEAIAFCGQDHLPHRLIKLGLSQRGAVLFIYLIAICVSIGAIILRDVSSFNAMLLLSQFILILAIIGILMGVKRKKKGLKGV